MMKAIARSMLIAAMMAVALTQVGARSASAQAVDPRFQSALLNLYYARWMLTHTSAVRANYYSYRASLSAIYQAIRNLNGIINVPSYRYAVPQYVPPGGPRLRAALGFLQNADRNLGAPSPVPRWDAFRNASFGDTRAAIGNVNNVLAACRC
ncbi:MAG: hypothetical protein JO018_01390 [Candidatus Eremiobacteraeota bacterium]|nr:hypothetical protein [Candidatus Eremiobacteraeota bacterium]